MGGRRGGGMPDLCGWEPGARSPRIGPDGRPVMVCVEPSIGRSASSVAAAAHRRAQELLGREQQRDAALNRFSRRGARDDGWTLSGTGAPSPSPAAGSVRRPCPSKPKARDALRPPEFAGGASRGGTPVRLIDVPRAWEPEADIGGAPVRRAPRRRHPAVPVMGSVGPFRRAASMREPELAAGPSRRPRPRLLVLPDISAHWSKDVPPAPRGGGGHFDDHPTGEAADFGGPVGPWEAVHRESGHHREPGARHRGHKHRSRRHHDRDDAGAGPKTGR